MAKKMPTAECTRQFYRAAVQRHAEARFLSENSNYQLASIYLGGYAVECALKAVLLANTLPKKHAETKATFRGGVARNFDWLRHQLRERGVNFPPEVLRHLNKADWWRTDLRYSTGTFGIAFAEEFLTSAEKILD